MVKTEETVSCVTKGWRDLFERSRLIPPPSHTVRQAAENPFTQSQGFQLSLHRLTAAHLLQEQCPGGLDFTYQLRVTLFDRNHQHFFGKTWKSLPRKMKNKTISFNEVLYFHTSLLLPSTLLVLELVSLWPRPDGSHQAEGRGFSVLELFTNRPEASTPDGDRRLNLHHGSPRGLIHPVLKDSIDYGSLLKVIQGTQLECVVKIHSALLSVMHLLPENVLVSANENIPGLAASPTGDALLSPQLLKMQPCTLNRLTISLQPSLEKFESQLLQLINADCHNTKQPGPEGTLKPVAIQERRLHVGVHNGWCFLDRPQVVVLEPLAPWGRGWADGTSKQSTLLRSSSTTSLPQTLGLRSSLEIKLTNHQAVAIVFQLEYVFSAPIGRETMLSATSTSRAAFLQCLRWGMCCPFQEQGGWRQGEIRLALRGGAEPNPHAVMVYSTGAPTRTLSLAPGLGKGSTQERSGDQDMISFWLDIPEVTPPPSPKVTLPSPKVTLPTPKVTLPSPKVTLPSPKAKPPSPKAKPPSPKAKPPSPKSSLKTKQEGALRQRRQSLSPVRGQRQVGVVTPPDSPRGPGLSLSQLAATSRYPTISHSSSALPWQQSFPSLLHPSPLASAHQLSHVAFPAVTNIAHLEMDLKRESDGTSLTQDEGEQLQELPFTPVHAPVITLGTNVPSSCSISSRNSLAHIFSAGFPDIMDHNGQVAEVLDPTEPLPYDPQREEADPLHGNLLLFQFLAFTRIPTAGAATDWPDNIYVTFQFYRFPPVTSQQLKLVNKTQVQQTAGKPLPCILVSLNKDDTINKGSPGLQVQFRVDERFLKPGEKRWFLRYLALHTMHIDVWDSDSLLLIGSTGIELKYMLRHGKSAVQALHEVEVLTTDYVGEDTLLMSTEVDRGSSTCPMAVHTIVRGRLHIRTGNIGCPADPSRRRASADVRPSHSHIIRPCEITSGFRGGSLSSTNNARNTVRAHRVEADGEREPMFRRWIGGDIVTLEERILNDSDEIRRKLSCMAAVHQREAGKDPKVAKYGTKGAQQATQLHQFHPRQAHSKAEGIANMLSQAITTHHLLYASLGSAEYMEFVLRNPFNVPQTVTIHCDDPELSVITSIQEWRYFKALTKTPTPLEENMFHLETEAPGPRVFLRPKECVHIPLKYQSFLCDHTMALQGPSFLPTGKASQVAKKNLSNIIAAKSIKVTFRAEDDKPMAICQVDVEPTPHVVDQPFRLYHPELSFLKKAIRLAPWHDPIDGDVDARTHISVRCSDPNIICQTRMLVPGEPQDVYLKVPGSPSPHIKMFFVMVFTDKWMAVPSQIWQIYVHFLERVDISCVTGQRTSQSVVLRGKQAVRKVKCFSSHPKEIKVDPPGVFLLPPAAVQELQLKVQPWQAGSRFLYMNGVDVEQRRLVAAWLLCLIVHRPILSKAFEVCVPVGSRRGPSRKITYTNPYTSRRALLLRSDHPDLLQFREDQFQIGGGESYTIGLRFAPSQSPGSAEILVYVNNIEEKTEETFCVKVNYT